MANKESTSGPKNVLIPCTVFPGMFSGELQFQVRPPGEEAIHVFAATSSSGININAAQVGPEGIHGQLRAMLVQDLGENLIIDLPGETLPRGPRIRVPKSFVLTS